MKKIGIIIILFAVSLWAKGENKTDQHIAMGYRNPWGTQGITGTYDHQIKSGIFSLGTMLELTFDNDYIHFTPYLRFGFHPLMLKEGDSRLKETVDYYIGVESPSVSYSVYTGKEDTPEIPVESSTFHLFTGFRWYASEHIGVYMEITPLHDKESTRSVLGITVRV